MNLVTKLTSMIRRKQIAPSEKADSESSIDMSNDITTYIRCLFHDFRGPLNNISMAVDVLLGDTTQKSQDIETLQTIQKSCVFMSESLDGFLNLQNVQNTSDLIVLKYEPFNIVGLIKKVQYILLFNIIDKKIEIIYNIKPLPEWVIGDHKHIQHVLVNLLSNAVKFSSKSSKILIKLESEPIVNKKQKIIISVLDENTWISPEIKANLFQKYITSDSSRGTGLGLYICKKIIDLHGGTIIHENYRGRRGSDNELFALGTTGNLFTIELELEVCASGADSIISEKHPKNLQKSDSLVSAGNKALNTVLPYKKKTNSELLKETNKCNMLNITKSNNPKSLSKSNNPFDESGQDTDKGVHKSVIGVGWRPSVPTIQPLTVADSLEKSPSIEVRRPEMLGQKTEETQQLKCNEMCQVENVNKIKIFIIDDSDISRKFMQRMFEQNCDNIQLYQAEDGLDAILKLNNKIHEVNLIMLDNIMPNITGVLLSKILRGIQYKGLIFGITGNVLDADRDEFINAGANYVFTKPFNKEKFDKMLYFIQNNGYYIVPNGKIVESESGKLGWKI